MTNSGTLPKTYIHLIVAIEFKFTCILLISTYLVLLLSVDIQGSDQPHHSMVLQAGLLSEMFQGHLNKTAK